MNKRHVPIKTPHRSTANNSPERWPINRILGLTIIILVAQITMISTAISGKPAGAVKYRGGIPDFGPNVTIFEPSMPTSEIQAKFDEIFALQRDNEMGSERYSLLFMPGVYGSTEEPLLGTVGYYTEVAGLGASPGDVQINGKMQVYNRCFEPDGTPADPTDPFNPNNNCFALNNFWRSLSNMTINVSNGVATGAEECRAGVPFNMWAVSQAVSMRRVDINGIGPEPELFLFDACSGGPNFASGGFIADSRPNNVVNGPQQQWITRNSDLEAWSNPVWNQVFVGVNGAPDDSGYAECVNAPAGCSAYTTIDTTPISREKPYLFVDEQGDFNVRVPSARRDTRGITWAEGMTPGRTVPLRKFFIADPSDSVRNINKALSRGRHLMLTPGVYDIAKSIKVKRRDTIVLGMGLATLHAVNGAIPLATQDKAGIILAGVTIDAGEVESPVLLQIGKKRHRKSRRDKGQRNNGQHNPVTLSDIYFRVGGPYVGKTDVALQINSDDVLIDHTWVWRADHGIEGFEVNCDQLDPENCVDGFLGDDIRWTTNIGRNGAVINGDDVTVTGLFVEHFQEYNTIWNGERGQVYLYQNELPYDPPTQADWMSDDGTFGWAAYKVDEQVKDHELWGAGSYIFNRNDPSIVTENAYEVPETPGVQLNNIMINNLSGPGVMNHIVNGCGPAVDGVADAEFGENPGEYENPRYLTTNAACP